MGLQADEAKLRNLLEGFASRFTFLKVKVNRHRFSEDFLGIGFLPSEITFPASSSLNDVGIGIYKEAHLVSQSPLRPFIENKRSERQEVFPSRFISEGSDS